MKRWIIGVSCVLLILWAQAGWSYYGSVEFLDGRILNGKIEVVDPVAGAGSAGQNYQLGLFVPAEGAYLMFPIVDIKRIIFNWNHNKAANFNYYLRNKGDITLYLVNGEVIQGAYFGNASGVRALKVVADDMHQEIVRLEDNKLNKKNCMSSLDFQTVHVPDSEGTLVVSMKSGKATVIHYRVKAEIAELHETPSGPSKAKLHYGVGLSSLETRGEWVRVKTVGDIEVEGWIRKQVLSREHGQAP